MGESELKITDRLALDRTWLAAERTLMSWVRTALSLISFGFTIYKFLQIVQQQSPVPILRPHTPRNVGLLLVGLGTLSLLIAGVQYRSLLIRLNAQDPAHPYKLWDMSLLMATGLGLIGLLLFLSILLRSGPFA